ncbi:hypothetical protein F5B22DRAFT_634829 [Xylaria bambusicola]|uniref:uncharacterized protein n=1 Tax=Xylaria bambusicola TaxID=326684 RepID=UPI002008B91E|nr:uncharacterized protein F5B22DRAFT_634829 [Xylaria bambusicola]KAI0520974.1 hypothetical protein F5B22DRAFT_634829 [Xylaria bambusicola]
MSDPESIPQVHRQPVAVDFVDKSLSRFHHAFAQHCYNYNPKLDRYVGSSYLSAVKMPTEGSKAHLKAGGIPSPPEIILSMRFWEKVLPAAMDKLRTYKEPKGRQSTTYNIRDLDSWDEIYSQLETCRVRYLDDQGWSKKVKRGWRKFSENIGPVQASWNLVPDIDYLTPIRGVVDCVFDAIKRASETRQQVLQGLDKLDSMFRDIELFLIVFPTDNSILEAGTELVVSVLVAVEKLIDFYIKSKGRKAVSSVFKSEDYEKDVISGLDDITMKSEALRHEATKADMSQSAENWRLAEQRHEELRRTLKDGHIEILQRQASLKAHAEETADRVNSVYNLLVEYERNQQERNAALQKRNEELEKSFSDLKLINYNLQRAITPTAYSNSHNDWRVQQDDLWDILSVFSFEEEDMQRTTEKQERLPLGERAATEGLLNSPRFREWVVSPISRELLVQGNLTGDRQISALSVFCSTFTTAIRSRPKYISLIHFCGLHADLGSDADAGAPGMIMSFIAQLLWQWDFDIALLQQYVDLSWVEYGEDPSWDDLYNLLKSLIRQLPPTQTVFFIIDGAYHYEKSSHADAFIESMAAILDTTLDDAVVTTVKILVTSPCRTTEIRQGFHDNAVLLLMEESGASLDASPRRFQHQVSRTFDTS